LVSLERTSGLHPGARLLLEVIVPKDELITDPGVDAHGYPRPETDGPSWLLDSWTLRDGRTVWVVASDQELDAGFWSLVGEARAQMTSQMEVLEASLVGGHMRAFVCPVRTVSG
jgi:hypothetical protein